MRYQNWPEGVVIRDCRVADILHPDNARLIDAYSVESSIAGMPPASAQLPTYIQLESAGALHCLGAYDGDSMVGFASILISVLPHYGVATAIMESLFVSSECRKTGAGTKLLRAAEGYAVSRGACGLLVSAPTGGSLVKMMLHPRSGFCHTNQVFFKGLE
ncbi:MAG: GNAT family N-acetyltransferase [Desulfuromonadaceae bacterium]